MNYYVMVCKGKYPIRTLDDAPHLRKPPWMHGSVVEPPDCQLVYILDSEPSGNMKAMYTGPEYPIMREDLITALQAAGVDNLQLFDAVVRDPEAGKEYTNYKAFNIVGVVAAADMDASELMQTSSSTMIDVDFDSLVIDEEKAKPHKLFRLAESVNAIIVSNNVRLEVERRGIPGMVFYDPRDWAG